MTEEPQKPEDFDLSDLMLIAYSWTEETQRKGRGWSNVTKREQAYEYARRVASDVRRAVKATRDDDGKINKSAVARWLTKNHVRTQEKNKQGEWGKHSSQSVDRIFEVADRMRETADWIYEWNINNCVNNVKRSPKEVERGIATFARKRDEMIEKAEKLVRYMRGD